MARAVRTTQVVALTLALCAVGPAASGERRDIEGKGAHAVARAGTPTERLDHLSRLQSNGWVVSRD